MEESHFYFAMFVSLVLLGLGLAVSTASSIGFSLLGLGCALAALALANRFFVVQAKSENDLALARIDRSEQ